MNSFFSFIYRIVAPIVVMSLFSVTAMSADGVQKLGFINTERVYQESRQAINIQTKLDKEFGSRQAQLSNLKIELDTLEENLNSTNIKDRENKEIRFKELDKKFKFEKEQLAEEYNLRRNEEFASLQQNANNVILKLAKENGYDLIIQDVIYVDKKFDITDSVIKALNRN